MSKCLSVFLFEDMLQKQVYRTVGPTLSPSLGLLAHLPKYSQTSYFVLVFPLVDIHLNLFLLSISLKLTNNIYIVRKNMYLASNLLKVNPNNS